MSEYSNSDVIILSNNDIIKKGNLFYINNASCKGKLALLKCYAPWCPHCTHMVNDIKLLASKFKNYFCFLTIDCDKYNDVTSKLGISGFPTLFFIDTDGKISEKYESSRDKLSIVNNISKYVENKLLK